jgi:hypothetical protein
VRARADDPFEFDFFDLLHLVETELRQLGVDVPQRDLWEIVAKSCRMETREQTLPFAYHSGGFVEGGRTVVLPLRS